MAEFDKDFEKLLKDAERIASVARTNKPLDEPISRTYDGLTGYKRVMARADPDLPSLNMTYLRELFKNKHDEILGTNDAWFTDTNCVVFFGNKETAKSFINLGHIYLLAKNIKQKTESIIDGLPQDQQEEQRKSREELVYPALLRYNIYRVFSHVAISESEKELLRNRAKKISEPKSDADTATGIDPSLFPGGGAFNEILSNVFTGLGNSGLGAGAPGMPPMSEIQNVASSIFTNPGVGNLLTKVFAKFGESMQESKDKPQSLETMFGAVAKTLQDGELAKDLESTLGHLAPGKYDIKDPKTGENATVALQQAIKAVTGTVSSTTPPPTSTSTSSSTSSSTTEFQPIE
jgi:hypothetical protein